MKKIKYIITLIMTISLSCSDDDKIIDLVTENVERGAVLRTLGSTNTYNFYDTSDSRFTFDVSVEAQGEANGAVPSTIRVYQSFKDNTDDGVDNSKTEALINTIDVSTLSISDNGFPEYTMPTLTLQEALDFNSVADGEFFGLDQFIYRFELETTDGRIFTNTVGNTVSGGSFYSSPYAYTVTIRCIPIVPFPGIYTIKMTDSYGDGWQTDDSGGGSGITLDLDGTVIEFGMCSPYADSDYACTEGDSAAETTVEIPEGTMTATWFFPGDFYGEIGFQIIDPFGDVALESAAGAAGAGELFLNICQ